MENLWEIYGTYGKSMENLWKIWVKLSSLVDSFVKLGAPKWSKTPASLWYCSISWNSPSG